jgi:hypothetical protein
VIKDRVILTLGEVPDFHDVPSQSYQGYRPLGGSGWDTLHYGYRVHPPVYHAKRVIRDVHRERRSHVRVVDDCLNVPGACLRRSEADVIVLPYGSPGGGVLDCKGHITFVSKRLRSILRPGARRECRHIQ